MLTKEGGSDEHFSMETEAVMGLVILALAAQVFMCMFVISCTGVYLIICTVLSVNKLL